MTNSIRTMAVLAAALATAAPAAAQVSATGVQPLVTLSAGYGAMRDTENKQTLPVAWLGSASLRLSPRLAGVAEMDGSYKTKRISDVDVNYRSHGLLVGLRTPFARGGRVTPFAQALVGGVCHCGSTVSDGHFSTGLALQVGGGADIALSQTLGMRVQTDVRNVRDNGTFFNQVRVAVGAVVGLARRER